jgi:hypothetical protein
VDDDRNVNTHLDRSEAPRLEETFDASITNGKAILVDLLASVIDVTLKPVVVDTNILESSSHVGNGSHPKHLRLLDIAPRTWNSAQFPYTSDQASFRIVGRVGEKPRENSPNHAVPA